MGSEIDTLQLVGTDQSYVLGTISFDILIMFIHNIFIASSLAL
jgi:hypothetical protein